LPEMRHRGIPHRQSLGLSAHSGGHIWPVEALLSLRGIAESSCRVIWPMEGGVESMAMKAKAKAAKPKVAKKAAKAKKGKK